jgi:rare lipoprotein A (peptidoglycan hydrolase)
MRSFIRPVLCAALLGFIPLAQAQAHWECMGFAVACEGGSGSAREARNDRYSDERPARRYADRGYDRDYGDRDYAPKRHRAEARHQGPAAQRMAALEQPKAQPQKETKAVEAKPVQSKQVEAKQVETKAVKTTPIETKAAETQRPAAVAQRPAAQEPQKLALAEAPPAPVRLAEAHGKTQSGMASYYGTESGSQTSSGEHFNPSAMTAAHRSLPFGTRVLVTNKRNGRSVIVRINDRGPFVYGRIIDLSTAAADVIGMRGAGVASVTVEVLGRS